MSWRSGDWIVHFMHRVCVEGYEWEPMPEYSMTLDSDTGEETLVATPLESVDARLGEIGCFVADPRGKHHRPLYVPNHSGNRKRMKHGARYARDASNAFIRLCDTAALHDVRGDQGDPLRAQQDRLTEIKRTVLQFANRFGLLWGDADPHSLADWLQECSHFRVAYAVSKMLRSKDFRAFRGTILDERQHREGIRFDASRWGAGHLQLFSNGQKFTQLGPDGSVQIVDAGEEFLKKSVPKQAWHVFTTIIAEKLNGGLSLAPGEYMGKQAGIINKDLINLLYLRLWRDVVTSAPVPRRCAVCGGDLPEGNRNRKYCSDACRQKNYRQRETRA